MQGREEPSFCFQRDRRLLSQAYADDRLYKPERCGGHRLVDRASADRSRVTRQPEMRDPVDGQQES